jgi:hypothetical protein
MPQLDLYMFSSLVYPFLIFFFILFVISQLLALSLSCQRYVFRYIIDLFDASQATFITSYLIANLRAFYFREFFVYATSLRLII